ncbi:hypothetical protein L1887_25394 [Cichorium endivia]|nr:hypothetical protein L1887_25394 [Cichorium endivia]
MRVHRFPEDHEGSDKFPICVLLQGRLLNSIKEVIVALCVYTVSWTGNQSHKTENPTVVALTKPRMTPEEIGNGKKVDPPFDEYRSEP